MLSTTWKDLPPHPQVVKSLQQYELIRQQLLSHFFQGKPLNMSNKTLSQVYTGIFNTLNTLSITGNKNFQCPDEIYYQAYLRDMTGFAKKVSECISMTKEQPTDLIIRNLANWINNYARFNHLIYRNFMVIERGSRRATIFLYSDGLKILKKVVIDSICKQIYSAILKCLELYKQKSFEDYKSLQVVIKCLGIIGFQKFKNVAVTKVDDGFEYQSLDKPGSEYQNPYVTITFKEMFITPLISDLHASYEKKASQMMQLDSKSYLQKVQHLIEIEEKTADLFYKPAKENIVRVVLKALVLDKAEKLLYGQDGLRKMMSQWDINNLTRILKLLKKAKEEHILCKQFQGFVHTYQKNCLTNNSQDQVETTKFKQFVGQIRELIIQEGEKESA